MTPDEVDILVAALDDCQDLVRKFARLRHPQMDRSYFGEIELLEHLKSAITLIQDYQKLRERVSGIDLPVKELGKIVMFIRHSMFLPENDKLSELNKMIREAIVTYLQQPTEH